ncbi:MAG: hypothetical protein ACYC3G_02985 [Minisyncoccota bacterium]
MFPSKRFDFSGGQDMATKVFENGHELKISISRGRGKYGPILMYTLEGGFDSEDGDVDLLQTAKDLLSAFNQLGRIRSKLDDCEDDHDCNC